MGPIVALFRSNGPGMQEGAKPMRKDPVTQINLRLDPELARKLKALSAISGRSLNSLITLAIDEYVFLRRATVLEGQKIVDDLIFPLDLF